MRQHTFDHYSDISLALHWISALLVIFMLILGYLMATPGAYFFHKSFGFVIFILTILRLIAIKGHPPYPASMKLWEKIIATTVKYVLYALLILLPVTGWIFSSAAGKPGTFFGLFTIDAPSFLYGLRHFCHEAHETLPIIMIALLVLHSLAALKHHYIDRDTILRRML